MFKLLLDCDLFGFKPVQNINKSETHQTIYGSAITLLVITGIIYFICHFGAELFYHKAPNVIVTNYNDADPRKTNISDGSFVLAFSLQNPDYSNFVDESIYYLDANLFSAIRKGNGEVIYLAEPIEMIKCSDKKFTLLGDYFKNMDLQNLYCMKNSSLFIQGEFGRDFFSYLKFSFKKCTNTTERTNCKSKEEIDRKLAGGYFGTFFSDSNIEPSDPTNPLKQFGKNLYTTFAEGIYKDFYIYMKTLQVTSDFGWVLEDKQDEYYFAMDRQFETWDKREIKDHFFDFIIRCANNRQVFDRRYIKVQEIAANVGGIIKFLLVCGEILAWNFRKLKYKEYLINFFYNVVDVNCLKEDSTMIQPKIQNFLNETELPVNKTKMIMNQTDCSLKMQELEKKQMKHNLYYNKKMTHTEIFRAVMHCKGRNLSKKVSLVELYYSKLLVHFDWIYQIKVQGEHESIKKIILSTNQSNILSLCNKQNNVPDLNEKLFNANYNLDSLPRDLKEEIVTSYFDLINNNFLDINKEILRNVDYNLKKTLEKGSKI